ncbi:unnamed protein product [Calypogeia fissa]
MGLFGKLAEFQTTLDVQSSIVVVSNSLLLRVQHQPAVKHGSNQESSLAGGAGIVILSDAIVKLNPAFFWLGGGEVDLKLGIRTEEFVKMINPFVVDCIY